MKLRGKTLLVVGSFLIVVIFALYMVARGILQTTVRSAEEQASTSDFDHFSNGLDWTLAGIDKTTRDWAWWDESYQFVQDGNQKFINSTLGVMPLINIGVNLISYVNTSGSIVFSMAVNLENQSEVQFPEDLVEHIASGSMILKHALANKSTSGVLVLHDGPLLVSAFPILASDKEGPVRGMLLMGRYLDSDITAGISSMINMPLKTYALNDPEMSNDVKSALAGLSENKPVLTKQISESILGEYFVIDDIYGKPTLAVRIDAPRPAYANAHSALKYFIIFFVVIGVFFGAATIFVVDRMVLSRIMNLNETAQRIGKGKDSSVRVMVSGKDEIANLGNSFNEMLTSIYDSQKSLRESEEKYRSLFDYNPDAVYSLDLAGNFLTVNQAACQMTGYDKEELLKMDFAPLVVLEDVENVRQHFLNAVEGAPQTFEATIVSKNGKRIALDVKNVPIVVEDKVVGVYGIAKNVTERKKAEHQANERMKELRAFYRLAELTERKDITHDEVFQKFTNILPESWQYPEIACARIVFDNSEFRTKNFRESAWMQSAPIKIRESVKGKIEVGYLEERPEEDEGPFLKEERFLINAIAERLGRITERKKADQELKESRERFIELVQLLPALVYEIDLAGNFSFLSFFAYKLFGYSEEDVVKMQLNALALLTPESKELASKDMMRLLEGIDRGPVEYYAVKKDGTVFPIELYAALISQEGKPVGFRGIILDITERKKTETAVSRYSDLLKIINRILRHDVINHLGVIISALRLYGKSKEEELLKEASHRANESVELIRKMKDLETMIALHKGLKPIDVRGEIEKIKEQYKSIAYDIKGEATVLADEALTSVIVNIMTNAIIHGKTERIDVNIEEKGEWCEIRIADYGIGIPDEIKGKIFEEGFRYGETGQSGLGLYIVKMVMERYEGSVHVEDNIPKGTVFVLRLRRVSA